MFLISHGADINRGPKTALHTMVLWWMPDSVEALLEAGADINARDEEGKTPLYHAIYTIEWLTMVELLVSHGADVKTLPSTTLHHTAEKGLPGITQFLIEAGLDPIARDKQGNTPLHLAADNGHVDVVNIYKRMTQTLNEAGLAFNAKDNRGNTPLHLAAGNGHSEVVKLLIETGADVNAIDDLGATPLQHALKNGHMTLNLIRPLVEAGADIYARDDEGDTPLIKAFDRGQLPLVNYLLSNGVDAKDCPPNALLLAVDSWSVDLTRRLIAAGADVNVRDEHGNSLLHLAVRLDGWTLDMAKLLIDAGVDINAKDKQGNTPLHRAVITWYRDMVELLVSRGADVNVKNHHGQSPKSLARSTPLAEILNQHDIREGTAQ
jgi:cytohesin